MFLWYLGGGIGHSMTRAQDDNEDMTMDVDVTDMANQGEEGDQEMEGADICLLDELHATASTMEGNMTDEQVERDVITDSHDDSDEDDCDVDWDEDGFVLDDDDLEGQDIDSDGSDDLGLGPEDGSGENYVDTGYAAFQYPYLNRNNTRESIQYFHQTFLEVFGGGADIHVGCITIMVIDAYS